MRFSACFAVIVAVACILLAPASAWAVIRIDIERLDFVPSTVDQTVFVDVFATDLDGSNEELAAFTVGIDGIGFTPNGLRLLPPVLPSAAHPYVFQGFPGSAPEDFGSTYNRIQMGAALPGPDMGVDVNALRNGLFSIPIHIPANFLPTFHTLTLDMRVTDFAGTGPTIVAVPGQPGVVLPVIPEPAAAGLVCAAAAMLLRRRVRR